MIRTLGGIVVGMAAAIALMMVTEAIGNQIAPAPVTLQTQDLTQTPAMPLLTLLFPILGLFLAALIGGFLAIKVSDRPWTAWTIAGAVLAATIFNFILMDYPTGVMVAGLILPVLGGWLAQKVCAMAGDSC